MALIASALERYPFWARTILWPTPILYIVIGEGIVWMWTARKRPESMVAVLLLVM
jgi:cytochrome c-type biogenesis protein CcmH/NrfF